VLVTPVSPTAAPDFGVYADVPVLVLGATGFIGRWTTRRLVGARADVTAVARDLRDAESVLEPLRPSLRVALADLRRVSDVRHLLNEHRPAVVFNLAGYGVAAGEREPESATQINTELVEEVARGLGSQNNPDWAFQRLVHVGTALEYGEATGDLHESTPAKPTTLYGRTKLEGTVRLKGVCAETGLRGITARLFTVYGPGEHLTRLLPTLCASSRTQCPIELTAGTQRRDFTYVDDVAEGLLRLGLSETPPGEVVNLATGRLTSVREFAETAARVIGLDPGRLRFGVLPVRPEEMSHAPVTVRRLVDLTGWRPPTDVTTGITQTWSSWREDEGAGATQLLAEARK